MSDRIDSSSSLGCDEGNARNSSANGTIRRKISWLLDTEFKATVVEVELDGCGCGCGCDWV